jgi:hypothetical protein
MPNWCSNVVTINHGDSNLIDAIENELNREKDDIALFQMLRPRPAEFEEEWYGWNIENWGTKWEASIYDFERIDDYNIRVNFDTAWGPPIALYDYLFEQGYDTTAYYDECGMAFCGKYEFGSDDQYDYTDMDSAQVQDEIPSDIDEMFSISEQMADRESEDDDTQTYSDDEDDIQTYVMTDWFNKKIKPSYEGIYEVKTKAWPFPHKSYFDGTDWRGYFGNIEDLGDIIKVLEWRGLAENPEIEEEASEDELQKALEELKAEFETLMAGENE